MDILYPSIPQFTLHPSALHTGLLGVPQAWCGFLYTILDCNSLSCDFFLLIMLLSSFRFLINAIHSWNYLYVIIAYMAPLTEGIAYI